MGFSEGSRKLNGVSEEMYRAVHVSGEENELVGISVMVEVSERKRIVSEASW